MSPTLILASASIARQRILENAGIPFKPVPSMLDEDHIKAEYRGKAITAEETTLKLALNKANVVSTQHPDDLVIGSDQMLTCEGRWFDKPQNINDLREHLALLSGRQHELVNATVIIERGRLLWCHKKTIAMNMRPLSNEFIESYIQKAGEGVYNSVGGYNIEGVGAQLFNETDADFFLILGLPLFPILDFLRLRGYLTH